MKFSIWLRILYPVFGSFKTFFICNIINKNYSISIIKKAFSDCGLFDIDIPDSVRTLHKDTFSDCCNLRTVIIGNKTKKISKNALPKETTIKTRRVKGAQDLKLKKNSLYGEWGCCDDKEDSVD